MQDICLENIKAFVKITFSNKCPADVPPAFILVLFSFFSYVYSLFFFQAVSLGTCRLGVGAWATDTPRPVVMKMKEHAAKLVLVSSPPYQVGNSVVTMPDEFCACG